MVYQLCQLKPILLTFSHWVQSDKIKVVIWKIKIYLKGLFGLTNIIINNRSSLTIIFRKLAEPSGLYTGMGKNRYTFIYNY